MEKRIVDEGDVFGTLLKDLSKVFGSIPHEFIIAKLQSYGFHIDALNLIHDYLSNRKQRVTVNDSDSSWKDIFYGIPKGLILGSLLFNIHLCDLFYILENLDIASYEDDATIYPSNETVSQSVIGVLETSSPLLFGSFNNNSITALIDGLSTESSSRHRN